VSSFELTVPFLNTHTASPKSEGDGDLHAGFLQLPKTSIVVLSELELQQGLLNEHGTRNIEDIQCVMNSQRLRYDFPFSDFELSTDLRFLVISCGVKSALLQTSISFSCQSEDSPSFYCAVKRPESTTLSAFRRLISQSDISNITISPSSSEKIQSDFVEDRKCSPGVSAASLGVLISLARALALLRGDEKVTIDTWDTIRALDSRRRSRQQ